MGRAFALARIERGDTVIVLGSNPAKGQRLLVGIGQTGAPVPDRPRPGRPFRCCQTQAAISGMATRYACD